MSTETTTVCIPNHIVIEIPSSTMCIPNNIMIEILLRIPTKTLYKRLRWVCKYWFNLITKDPNFAKMHMTHHSSHNNPCVLMKDSNEIFFKSYFNYNTYHASSDQEILDFPLNCIPNNLNSLISCNGLIFFNSRSILDENETLCIWNPCTREYRLLPDPPVIYQKERITYGFGYDRTIDDYKVVTNASKRLGTNVQVYTLGTNSWRNIGYTMYRLGCHNENGVYMNGAIYWIDIGIKKIISFDIENEKYQEVSKGPDLSNEKIYFHYAKLFAFEGSLCLFTTGSYCILTDIPYHMWVMNKDYDMDNNNDIIKSDSWTKVCLILEPFLQPLKFAKNGHDIVMMDWTSSYLMLLNPKNHRSTTLDGHDIVMMKWARSYLMFEFQNHRSTTLGRICEWKYSVVAVYIESLVSLNSGMYVSSSPREYKSSMKDRILKFFQLF